MIWGIDATTDKHLLYVDGNSGDSINLLNTDGWTKGSDTTVNSNIYSIYTSGNAQILIDTDTTVTMA